jgi:hypothetical protein
VEVFLEAINIHCFRKEMDRKEFVFKIDEVSNLDYNLDISIYNIPVFINQKTKQLPSLAKK